MLGGTPELSPDGLYGPRDVFESIWNAHREEADANVKNKIYSRPRRNSGRLRASHSFDAGLVTLQHMSLVDNRYTKKYGYVYVEEAYFQFFSSGLCQETLATNLGRCSGVWHYWARDRSLSQICFSVFGPASSSSRATAFKCCRR